ncbi:M60 family metallopeptidase [Solitalea koreensis]|nr:M60 family metallopeptidase [Solitalea koreensis]
MKKFFTLFIAFGLSVTCYLAQAQVNLIAGWDANGKTGSGSEPNKWGWTSNYTGAVWATANSSASGVVLYTAVTHPKSDGTNFNGSIFRYRWDAAYWGGSLSLGKGDGTSTKISPIGLTKDQTYKFSGLYEWWSNGSSIPYRFSISDAPYGGKIIASFDVPAILSTKQKVLYPFNFNFKCPQTGNYYIQVKQTNVNGGSSTLGTLLGLAQLSLTQTTETPTNPGQAIVQQGYPVPVLSSSASQFETGKPLSNTVDGSLFNYYSSPVAQNVLPVTLDYNFSGVGRIDSLAYWPYLGSSTVKRFGSVSVYYSTTADPSSFIKLLDYDFNQSALRGCIALNGPDGLINPATVRIVVNSSNLNPVGCGEMEFLSAIQPSDATEYGCNPKYSADLHMEEKKTIISATSSSFQPGFEISKSFDGNPSTYYNTQYSTNPFPVTINYTLAPGTDKIDYLIYSPRPNGDMVGAVQETEIWYSSADNPSQFTKIMDFNFNAPAADLKVVFAQPLLNPAVIRMIVKTANAGRSVAFSEMAFYKDAINTPNPYPTVFKDDLLSGLNATVTQADINGLPTGFYKSVAQCMLNKTYDTKFRIQSYGAFKNLTTLQNELKTGSYSPFENPTGIYFAEKDTAIVFAEGLTTVPVQLKVRNYQTGAIKSYPLKNGINILALSNGGNSYVSYYSDDYVTLPKVKVHIASGLVNGYYDIATTTAEEWREIAARPVSEMIDLKGKHVNLLYPISELVKYNPNDVKPLVALYDSLVNIEWEQMGLYKYNRLYGNRMFGEADTKSFSWFAGSLGAHFSGSTNATCDPAGILANPWGVAHEFGHVNQIRPGLRWAGTAEVTNNIYSAVVNYQMAPQSSYLETKTVSDGYYNIEESGSGSVAGNSMPGGRYNAFLNNALLKKQVWLYQYGPDCGNGTTWQTTGTPADHFVKLIPLWQLVIYYQYVHPEKKDWFKDIAEKMRTEDQSGFSDGQLILNFMKNTCDAVKEDLTEFFTKTGMLRAVDRDMTDYGSYHITITVEDSIALSNYIRSKNYPKPESPVLQYLSINSLNAYKNKLAVQGTVPGEGCAYTFVSNELNGYKNYVTVDHSVWKNVAVYETYAGPALKRLTMVGSGFADNSKTRVYYPTGATSIYAVGWDGTRTLVYGVSVAIVEPKAGTIEKNATTIKAKVEGNVSNVKFYINGEEKATVFQSPYQWDWTNIAPGKYGIQLKATDYSGLSILSDSVVVTVKDATAPVITCLDSIVVHNDADQCVAIVNFAVTAIDDFGQATITYSQNPGTIFPVGTTIVTVTATDEADNRSTCSFPVTVKDVTAPVITAPEAIIADNDDGQNGAVVTFTAPVGTDNCTGAVTTQTAGLPSGSFFPVGTTTNTFVVTDGAGNTSTCAFTVTVTDTQAPLIAIAESNQVLCYNPNGSYTVDNIVASDNVGVKKVSYQISGATNRTGTGVNASGSYNLGISTITWTVTDLAGNTSTAQISITVNSPITTSVADVYAVNPGGDANTIYLGYGPSSLTLTAQASGGSAPYTYAWSNGATSASAVVNPTAVGVHDFTVTVTDAKGCVTTFTKQVIVRDIRSAVDKVFICHNGTTSSISVSAVQAHLNHGDKLGECGLNLYANSKESLPAAESTVVAYPNPFDKVLSIKLPMATEGQTVNYEIYDVIYNRLVMKSQATASSGQINIAQAASLASGQYMIKISVGQQIIAIRIMK